jgi:hypothetical protein
MTIMKASEDDIIEAADKIKKRRLARDRKPSFRAGYVQNEDVQETGHIFEWASPR